MVLDFQNIFSSFSQEEIECCYLLALTYTKCECESFLKLQILKPSEALTDSTLSVVISSLITLLSPLSSLLQPGPVVGGDVRRLTRHLQWHRHAGPEET